MYAGPKHLLSRPGHNLPPRLEFEEELKASKQVFHELVAEYNLNNTELRTTRFVCNLPSNSLTLKAYRPRLEGSSESMPWTCP